MLKPLNRPVKVPLRDPNGPKCKCGALAHPLYGGLCEDCAVGRWGCARSSSCRDVFKKEDGEEGDDDPGAHLRWLKNLSLEEKLRQPLSELRLSTRVENHLEKERGVITIGGLVQLTRKQVKATHNLGAGSLNEVIQLLRAIGLALKTEESKAKRQRPAG